MLKLNDIKTFKWINCMKNIFNEIGKSEWFMNQCSALNINYIKQILHDQFIQYWYGDIASSSRGEFYSLCKSSFGLENYLVKLPEFNRIWITKLRTSNVHLPIETGRWHNIPRHERICSFCDNSVGDEFHVLFVCDNVIIKNLRQKFLAKYYYEHPNSSKMSGLLSLCNIPVLKKLSVFVKKISSL